LPEQDRAHIARGDVIEHTLVELHRLEIVAVTLERHLVIGAALEKIIDHAWQPPPRRLLEMTGVQGHNWRLDHSSAQTRWRNWSTLGSGVDKPTTDTFVHRNALTLIRADRKLDDVG
jgi:hypothetical protein